jgi:hypothetical protein
MGDRKSVTDEFYRLLEQLSSRLGGTRRLSDCTGAGWPSHGVYFFFEEGETRADGSPRVVRIGTHALTVTSQTRLWARLAHHRGHVGGARPGGGNHRGSIFRHHVGTALLARDDWPASVRNTWRDREADREAKHDEYLLERAVSDHIRAMPLLWLDVSDRGLRGVLERNSIGLLSHRQGGLDEPSAEWLGRYADSEKVRSSGLWNVNHVDDQYDVAFVEILDQLVQDVGRGG